MKPPLVSAERRSLLDDYASIARRRGPRALEATALRTRSEDLRELSAHLASHGELTFAELASAVEADRSPSVDALWTASLGRIVALQNRQATDRALGARLLEVAIKQGIPKRQDEHYSRLLIELSIESGDYGTARRLLAKNKDAAELDSGYLLTDLENPFVGSPYGDYTSWSRRFAVPFEAFHLESPVVDENATTPFNSLTARVDTPSQDGPLVTVILTTFKPRREDLLLSAQSILDQTHQNIELLVVDDASPAEFDSILVEVATLDPRVRLIRCETNGGTYLARNIGLREAQGRYVTCQDADDWSHPRRIEQQIAPLETDPDLPGTRSRCLAVLEDMRLARPGYRPRRPNASSLLFRRDHGIKLGGFLESRRAADSEFHQRLEADSGREVLTLNQPLAIIRILNESLSRSDFRAGWSHPARRAFVDSYQLWHESGREGRLNPSDSGTVVVPDRFSVRPAPRRAYDVVFAGDWRSYGGPQRSMLEEIKAALGEGLTVGVMHLEAARFMTGRGEHLCHPIQVMLNERSVRRVFLDDEHAVRLLVLRYPPILQFAEPEESRLSVGRLAILANQAPAERDGSDRRYLVEDCDRNALRLFGQQPLWIPQGPVVREAIREDVDSRYLFEHDIPGILDVKEWTTERKSFRSDRPVIGRHSRDNVMKWPGTSEALREAYPTDGRFDVRVMGGIRSALTVLRENQTPAGWVSFDKDELEVRAFLNSLDFFVNYTHDQANEAFGRSVLEALATGCVTLLPRSFEKTFGDAALYPSIDDVQAVIRHLYDNPQLYRRQSLRAQRFVEERFSYASFTPLLMQLLDGPNAVLEHDHPAVVPTNAGQ